MEKRSINDKIFLKDICFGGKLCLSEKGGFDTGFIFLEKTNYATGISGKTKFFIYKDIEFQTQYTVDETGRLFIPKKSNKSVNGIISFTTIKSLLEISERIIELYKGKTNINKLTKSLLNYCIKVNQIIENANETDENTRIRIMDLESIGSEIFHSYSLAFGNPLSNFSKELDKEGYKLKNTGPIIIKEKKPKFRIIEGSKESDE